MRVQSDDDTIAAISTPLGEGGIGIVRLSGKHAVAIASTIFTSPRGKSPHELESFRLTYGHIIDPSSGEKIDEVLLSVMRAPHSYTREDVVEINCHGGMIALRRVLELALTCGARLAEPGEFTKRAFLNGRIDLSQAEAVIDLIRAKTDASRKIALGQLQGKLSEAITSLRDRIADVCVKIEAYIDFPEEEIEMDTREELTRTLSDIRRNMEHLSETYEEGRFFRDGLSTVIVGKPNVGKSSLLNALLQQDRAIVTEIPGTTRDVIEEYVNMKGLPLRIMDTAGIREGKDLAEREGVKRSLRSIHHADLVIALFDGSAPLEESDRDVLEKVRDKQCIFVLNKADLPRAIDRQTFSSMIAQPAPLVLEISALRGDGLAELKDAIFHACIRNWREARDGVVVTNLRHKNAIHAAAVSIQHAIESINEDRPIEITALELRDALDRLGEIVGAVTTEDILQRIFSEFCIGK